MCALPLNNTVHSGVSDDLFNFRKPSSYFGAIIAHLNIAK